jgi:GntR family transcriptional repressor for pyruvate dehydrogenase complex
MIFRPLITKRKSELVSEEIRASIISHHFKPGDRLSSERDLAHQMHVGRSVIRESLRTLENSGLVYIKQGMDGGIFVKAPNSISLTKSFSDLLCFGHITIDDLSESRILIEKDVIELVMKKGKQKDFELLDDIIHRGFSKIRLGEKIRKENFEFHVALAKVSKNPVFMMIVDSIMPLIITFVEKLNPPPDHSLKILEGHRDILKAIKRRNFKKATERLEDHILFFNKEFKKVMPQNTIQFDDILRAGYLLDNVPDEEKK